LLCLFYLVFFYYKLQFYKLNFCMIAGTVYGGLGNPKLTFSDNVNFRVGNNKLSLLSVAVGLPVSSPFSDI